MFRGKDGTGPKGASLADVARRAGVSAGTVSNVLNRPDRVAASTRAGVEEAIAGLGFVRGGQAHRTTGPSPRGDAPRPSS
ncbi:LacI family DNA-binding transcriptional regulator [Actinomadura sp. HBU206391]|uniref:LacI family DNA-binding transcriptional regulator n=1 Tax=Actinomadura sp. HBU206391 TaxID=2731692 RepID=UPI0039671C66